MWSTGVPQEDSSPDRGIRGKEAKFPYPLKEWGSLAHKRVVFGCMSLLKSLLARTQLALGTLQFSAPTTRVQLNLNPHVLHLVRCHIDYGATSITGTMTGTYYIYLQPGHCSLEESD